jgi:hypothetical protein
MRSNFPTLVRFRSSVCVFFSDEIKIKIWKKVILKVFNCHKWEKKEGKIARFIFLGHGYSQKYTRMIKICTSFLVKIQIWLNLPRDDSHFGNRQKFQKKTLRPSTPAFFTDIIHFCSMTSQKVGIMFGELVLPWMSPTYFPSDVESWEPGLDPLF